MDSLQASELEAIADGIRIHHAVSGPDKRGDYHTSTEVCHQGNSPDKLSFGPRGINCFTREDCPGASWNTLREAAGLPARANRAERVVVRPTATYSHSNTGNPKRVYRLDCVGIGCSYPSGDGGLRKPCNGIAIDPKKGRGKHIWQDPGPIRGYLLLLWPPLEGDSGEVVIVEGEKAAAAVRDAGFVGASYLGGAKNVRSAVYTPVKGRDVVVWPDADAEGRASASIAAALARDAGANTVRMVEAMGEDGADAADIEPDEVRQRIERAEEWVGGDSAPEASHSLLKTGPHRLAAERAVDALKGQYRYDPNIEVFHRWDGRRWHEMPSPRSMIDEIAERRYQMASDAAAEGLREVADVLSDRKSWENAAGKQHSEFMSHLRVCISRPVPSPPLHELATPAGVLDLRYGSLTPHDPFTHDTLAVTRGNYRPQSADQLRSALWQRLRHNMDNADFGELMRALGIAIARRSRDYISIVWLYGASGGGKGFTANLIRRALGEHGKGVSASLLSRRTGDIDADLADLLEADPVVIATHEVEEVGIGRLNSMTGGDEMSARRPHGKTIRRALTGMMLVTSVSAPKMAADSGLRRRICVIHFPASYRGSKRDRAFTNDELDAIVTLGVIEAMNVGKEGWEPPTGNTEAKREFLMSADPVAAWLDELPVEKYAGALTSEALAAFNEQADEEVSSRLFGLRVNAHPRWQVKRRFRNGKVARVMDSVENSMFQD